MAASNNEIYGLLTEFNGKLGELTGTVKAINEKVDVLGSDMSVSETKADSSRANVHRRLDEVVMRTGHLESDLMSVKNKVEGMEKVTVEVTTLRTRAEGAGTLGRWLISLTTTWLRRLWLSRREMRHEHHPTPFPSTVCRCRRGRGCACCC